MAMIFRRIKFENNLPTEDELCQKLKETTKLNVEVVSYTYINGKKVYTKDANQHEDFYYEVNFYQPATNKKIAAVDCTIRNKEFDVSTPLPLAKCPNYFELVIVRALIDLGGTNALGKKSYHSPEYAYLSWQDMKNYNGKDKFPFITRIIIGLLILPWLIVFMPLAIFSAIKRQV
jgi:hypothetical protein